MKEDTEEMHKFFRQLWDKQEDDDGFCYCFESKIALPRKLYRENTCCYSHILSKSKYPEYKLKSWNVKIVHPSQHNQYDKNPDKTPKQKGYRDQLIKELEL